MSKIVSNKLALTAILLTTVIAFSINTAYAQELGTPAVPSGDGIALDDVFEIQNLIQVGIAFVLGGIGWAILGWQKHRRQEGTPFSYSRLGKTCVVGIGIGVFSLAVMVYTDSSIEHLYATTMHGFLQLVVWSFMCVTTTAAVAKKLFPDAFDKINSDNDLVPTEPSGDVKVE